jgi:O-antigen/teichoic acid export membrane protein
LRDDSAPAELPPPLGLRARLRSGVAWNLLAAGSTQGATLVVNLVVSNLLGRQGFGQYGIVYSTLLTLGTVAQLAIGFTATRYVAETRSADPQRAGRVLGLCTLVAAGTALLAGLGLLVAAPWLASGVLGAPQLTLPLRLAGGVAAAVVLNGFQSGALAGLEAFRAMGRSGLVSGLVGVGACALGARWVGLPGAVAGLLASGTVQALLLRRALRLETARAGIVVRYRGLGPEARILSRFALPAAMSQLSFLPAQWLASTLLVRHAGYAQMALFSAATTLRVLVVFVPHIVNNVGMSLLSHEWGRGDPARYRRLFLTNVGLTGGVTLLGAVGVVSLGPLLLRAFGRGFDDGLAVLRVLVVAAICEGLAISVYQVVISREKMWFSFLGLWLPRDLLLVCLARAWVGPLQAVGLATAHACAWALLLVMILAFAWWTGIRPPAVAAPTGSAR